MSRAARESAGARVEELAAGDDATAAEAADNEHAAVGEARRRMGAARRRHRPDRLEPILARHEDVRGLRPSSGCP